MKFVDLLRVDVAPVAQAARTVGERAQGSIPLPTLGDRLALLRSDKKVTSMIRLASQNHTHKVVAADITEERRIQLGQSLTKNDRDDIQIVDKSTQVEHTSAMSIRIPFSLFLNVGGNRLSSAKCAVWPAASPSVT